MRRRRHCGLCSWAAVLLFYTVSVHVQGAQSQSTTTDLPVTPLPSTINPNTVPASTRSTPNPPTPPTVPDSQSTVTNSSVSTVQLITSVVTSSTPDRTTAITPTPITTPESPTPTPITSPQITTTSTDLPTTTPEITTLIPTTTPEPPTITPTTTPQIITTSHDLPATTPETTYIPTTTPESPTTTPTTTPQITTTTPEKTTPIPPAPTTAPESPTTVPTTTPQLISTSTDLPSTPPPVTTTDLPSTAPQITTTRTPTTTPQITTTDALTTTTHIATTNASVTTPLIATTDVSTTLPQITTADVPVTTPEITAPVSSTPMPTTTPQFIAVTPNFQTPEPTTTNPPVQTTTPVPSTTTPDPTTTPERTTTIPTTTPEPPTPTPDISTTTPQIIAVTPDFPTPEPTTTNPLVQTTTPVPPTTTPDPTTTPERTTTIPTTTPEPPTPTPDIPTTTPQIIAVTPNVPTPEPTTINPPAQTTTPAPTTMPAPTTTPERTTTIPTTTPEPPTPTQDIPITPIITTTTTTDLPTPEITTTTPPMPTTTPELPTTTPYSPTTVPQIVTTTPDVPTTPQITTATTYFHITTPEITTPIPTTTPVPTTVPIPITTPETTYFPTTTPEITTPIPPMPTTTPELPTTVPIPTTTPEITTTTTDFPTTTPEKTTPVPIIPTTTPEPPTTTTPQIITDLPTTTTAAPIPMTTPKAPTTIPDSPTTSPQTVSTAGSVVVVSPVDSTGLTTTEIGNSTTAPPKVVDLWMPIVAGVGASMVVLIIVIIIIACVTCCNRPVQLDEKYLTDEEEMLPLGKTNGTAGRAHRERRSDRPNRNSTARKQTDIKPKTVEKFRVKESYKSEAEDQISLVKGEEVEVINKPTDDWWFGRSQQKIGWFPTKYLQAAGSVTPTGTENPAFVNDEDSSLPDPPPSLQAMPLPVDTTGSDVTLPVRATGETTDDSLQRKASLSNISLPPPPPELLAHEDETAPPARSVDNISIGSVSTSASLRNMSLGNLDFSENRQTTPPNGRSGSDSPESVASTAQSVSSSRPPSRASSYMSRTPSTLGSPNIPWMGSVGRSHVRTHPRVKAVLKNGQPDMEENRMHLIMNTNLPDRDASMRSSRSGRSSEDRSGRDRKLSVALRLTEPESALELDLPPPPPEFDSPKPADASPLTERYIAVYGYRATDDNQLNLEEDDVITVHERDPLGWARGVCIQTGKEGWFPESYVKKLGEDKKDSKATRTPGPPQRPAPKPPTDKAKRDEAESSSAPDPSVQSGQGTLTRKELRPRPSVRKSLMNRQPSVKGPSDTDDGPGRPMVAVRPSSHEQPAPPHQNRGTFGAPPPPIKSERSPTYSISERKPSVRASGQPVQGSVQDTGPTTTPVKPPRQPSQRHSVATTPKPPTIVRSPSRRVSMPINFDLLEESSIDDTPSQGSHKARRPPNLNLGSFQPHPQQEVGPTSPLSRSRPSRSSVTAAPDIMKTLEELDLQDTQLRTAIETFTMRGPGYLNFTKGDVILELEESDIPGWSFGELQDGTRGIFPVSSTENAATFV